MKKRLLIQEITRYIEDNHLFGEQEHILIALSGGADSVCLFSILCELQQKKNIKITALHVNHGIRGDEADRDEKFVINLCKSNNIDCIVKRVDAPGYAKENKLSLEEAGRKLRYEALEEAFLEIRADKIATAHHAEDLAETMIFFLARGTSIKGLFPIQPIEGKYIRPLLAIEKKDILEYLHEENIAFVEDSTNEDDDITRNLIRHTIIPQLRKINAQAVLHLLMTSRKMSEAEEVLSNIVREQFERCVELIDGDSLIIEGDRFPEEKYLRSEIVKHAIEVIAGASKDITTRHVEDVLALFDKQVGRSVMLPYGVNAKRDYDGVRINNINCVLTENEDIFIEKSVFKYEKGVSIPEKEYTKWFDYDIIGDAFIKRKCESDDYLIINSQGQHKLVKDLLKDEKIPLDKRSDIEVIAVGNHVFWVIGVRMAEDAKINEHTRKVLEIKIKGKMN